MNKPKKEGGLGLQSLKHINTAMIIKLAWSFLEGKDELGKLLIFKYVNSDGDIKTYYKKYSIWPGLKEGLKEIKKRSRWLMKDGTNVDFWHDNWVSNQSLRDEL